MNNFVVNSFQMPNALVDELLSKLSGSELKCYLVIVRKTKGWNKLEDAISISQFEGLTGLSNRAIIDACKNLENYGLIESKKGYRNTTVYMCKNFTCEEKSHMNKTTTTCEENDISPVKKVHTQNNTNTKYTNTKYNKENTKEKSIKPKDKFDPLLELTKRGADKQKAEDFLINRKTKRSGALTRSIIEITEREAEKAGLTFAEVIAICAERGWAGFRAHYNLWDCSPQLHPQGFTNKPLSKQEQVEAHNRALLEKYRGGNHAR